MGRISSYLSGIGGALLIVGCSTNTPIYTPPDARRNVDVVVRHFKTDLVGTEYSGQTDFGVLLAENLAAALQERGFVATSIPRDASIPDGIPYEFDGDILRLEPGSWGLRFWIGFGSGRAMIAARGWVNDLNGTEVMLDDTLRAGSATWQGEENILRRACSKVARSFARKYAAAMAKARKHRRRPR